MKSLNAGRDDLKDLTLVLTHKFWTVSKNEMEK